MNAPMASTVSNRGAGPAIEENRVHLKRKFTLSNISDVAIDNDEVNDSQQRLVPEGEFDSIDGYRMFQVLGKGSYGTVRLGQRDCDSELVAIKCISKKRIKRKGGLGRGGGCSVGSPNGSGLFNLRKEIAILKHIQHPNVVKLHTVIEDSYQDTVYMVLELLSFGPVMNMSDAAQPGVSKALPESLACTYSRQLLLAVEHIHAYGVVHRDIKPENLLLYSHDVVKLSDFGVSHVFEGTDDSVTRTAGTPAFMAPEAVTVDQLQYSGYALDVWATGVTIYCFLLGQPPFQADSIPELYRKIREDEPTFETTYTESPALTEDSIGLVRRLMCKMPHSRPSISAVRHHPWLSRYDNNPLPPSSRRCTATPRVMLDDVEASISPNSDFVRHRGKHTCVIIGESRTCKSDPHQEHGRRHPLSKVTDSQKKLPDFVEQKKTIVHSESLLGETVKTTTSRETFLGVAVPSCSPLMTESPAMARRIIAPIPEFGTGRHPRHVVDEAVRKSSRTLKMRRDLGRFVGAPQTEL